MSQSPLTSVVQVKFVAISSGPWGGDPYFGALSVNSVNTAPSSGLPSWSILWICIRPQLVNSMKTGAMKSFSPELKELDERLLSHTALKVLHRSNAKILVVR